LFIVIDVKVIVDKCMINLIEIICHPSSPPSPYPFQVLSPSQF
jgi:hypothetical protein